MENNYYIYRHRDKNSLDVFYIGASKQDYYKRAYSKKEINKIVESRKWYKHSKETKTKISVNRKDKYTGKTNWRSVRVIDTINEKEYECIREAAEDLGIGYQKLADMLAGRNINTTTLIKI